MVFFALDPFCSVSQRQASIGGNLEIFIREYRAKLAGDRLDLGIFYNSAQYIARIGDISQEVARFTIIGESYQNLAVFTNVWPDLANSCTIS